MRPNGLPMNRRVPESRISNSISNNKLHQMKKTSSKNKLQTSARWAIELRHDRGVLTKALDRVKHDGRRGKFKTYSLATVRAALEAHAAGKRTKRGLSDELLHEKIRSIEIRNRIADGSLIPVTQVTSAISSRMALMNSTVNQRLVNELPAICAGLPVSEIRLKATALIAELMGIMHELQRDLEIRQ